MSIGKIIKFLRSENGLTQKELADILQVKKSSIQKYESNDVPNLKIDTIRKLSNSFNISATAFVFPEKYRKIDLKTATQIHNDIEKHTDILLCELNEYGRNKVFEYARDLSANKKYKIGTNERSNYNR